MNFDDVKKCERIIVQVNSYHSFELYIGTVTDTTATRVKVKFNGREAYFLRKNGQIYPRAERYQSRCELLLMNEINLDFYDRSRNLRVIRDGSYRLSKRIDHITKLDNFDVKRLAEALAKVHEVLDLVSKEEA